MLISSKLTKEEVRINLEAAADSVDLYLSEKDLDKILKHGYAEMQQWDYGEYRSFVLDILNDGNVSYVLKEYGMIPDNPDIDAVFDWLSEHKVLFEDFAICFSYDPTNEKSELPTVDHIIDWISEHEQAWEDFCEFFDT